MEQKKKHRIKQHQALLNGCVVCVSVETVKFIYSASAAVVVDSSHLIHSLQCFDAVGCAAGRASGL